MLIRELAGGFPSGPAVKQRTAQTGRTYESNRSPHNDNQTLPMGASTYESDNHRLGNPIFDSNRTNQTLTRRPHWMVKVYNVGVFVFQRLVSVRMSMRFRSLPALVLMSMVFFVDMLMFVLQRVVPVLQFARVVGRPQSQSGGR